MNCFSEDLLQEYFDDELSLDQKQLVELHLKTCTQCSEYISNLEYRSNALFFRKEKSDDFTQSVMSKIVQKNNYSWYVPSFGLALALLLSFFSITQQQDVTLDQVLAANLSSELFSDYSLDSVVEDL